MATRQGTKQVTANKKAWHDYFIEEKIEAGIELFGTEVKSIRQGTVSLKESYCIFRNGEVFIKGMQISPYEKGNVFNRDPLREKKLLLHKKEIMNLFGKVKQDGYSLIPLSLYFRNSKVKVEIGLAKGKKLHDKRDSIARKDAAREIDREMKSRNR